jgi:hypothetical protein
VLGRRRRRRCGSCRASGGAGSAGCVLLGQLLSISALALEEFSFRRHPHGREILRMLGYAAVENLGYRQLSDIWRGMAFWDLARRRRSWGEMTRRGFQTAPTEQPGEPSRAAR